MYITDKIDVNRIWPEIWQLEIEGEREHRLSELRQNIRNNARRRERANEAHLANSTVIAIRVRRNAYRQQRVIDTSQGTTHLLVFVHVTNADISQTKSGCFC